MDEWKMLMGLEQNIKAIDSDLDALKERLHEVQAVVLRQLTAIPPASEAPQPTTVEPTTTAPIQAGHSDAEPLRDSVLERVWNNPTDTAYDPPDATTPTIRPSSQSATKTEDAGPVGQSLECAHRWMVAGYRVGWKEWEVYHCPDCDVWKFGDKILVPAAGADTSTSVKPLLRQRVEALAKESATLPLNALTNGGTTEAGDTGQDACKHVWLIEAERLPQIMWAWKDPVMTVHCENCPATEELALLRYRRL